MLARSLKGSLKPQLVPYICQTRWQSTTSLPNFEHLKTSLPARNLPILYDDLTPRNSHNLNISLQSYVPTSWLPPYLQSPDVTNPGLPRQKGAKNPLPPSHHLVYFNPVLPSSVLLPDGTDPNQSPGLPFVRRMWAGGYVKFHPQSSENVQLSGRRFCCVEGIRSVDIKGKPGSEKVFVGIERRIGVLDETDEGETKLRARIWGAREDDFADSLLIERRNIVFMRERTTEELHAVKEKGAAPAVEKMLKPQHAPTFTHTLIPDATLLFRYSALTFNAHAIHLDPSYCRNIEGHRNLLFHGPLSFTLLTLMLQDHIRGSSQDFIEHIEYRNLAPLYAGEPLKLCGREVGDSKFEIWAETPEGGLAVKGTARVGARSGSPFD